MQQNMVVGLRPIISTRNLGLRASAIRGSLTKRSQLVFTRVLEKTTENSERPGRHALPRIEPGISQLPFKQNMIRIAFIICLQDHKKEFVYIKAIARNYWKCISGYFKQFFISLRGHIPLKEQEKAKIDARVVILSKNFIF